MLTTLQVKSVISSEVRIFVIYEDKPLSVIEGYKLNDAIEVAQNWKVNTCQKVEVWRDDCKMWVEFKRPALTIRNLLVIKEG
jgi:hypothetical protein